MKERYYYLRDEKNRPMTTICLMERNGIITKGVALCSEKDIPCKKVGRKIAKERAKHAMLELKDSCITKRKESRAFSFKSVYMPVLTEYEDKILGF